MRVKINKEGVRETALVKGNKVHKVLHCRNSVGSAPSVRCGTTWNRDVNAAKNMLLLLQVWIKGDPRPAAFCKPHKNTVPVEASLPFHPTGSAIELAGVEGPLSGGPVLTRTEI